MNFKALLSFQVVSLSSLVSMFVPRAFVLCDMLSHLTFLFGAYQLIALFVSYVGGESAFIKQCSEETAFVLRTPPCCCCCVCWPPMLVTKSKFTFIRLLIVQFLLVQGVVFVALNVIYIESAVSAKRPLNRWATLSASRGRRVTKSGSNFKTWVCPSQ